MKRSVSKFEIDRRSLKSTPRSRPRTNKNPHDKTTAEKVSFPVVAIGASAGGLEAYTEFFRALSADTGMAFVLVQHLDPTHRSLLTELIAKTTRMPVEEVKSGIKIKPDRTYVIPPDSLMALAGGVLKLTPRSLTRNLGPQNQGPRQHGDLAINFFMRSLAQERKNGAIGIVLSGTGSDGTAGLENIKAEGGLTFAQEPASAKYDGMPRSAIDSGCVDFILSPGEIAKELTEIRRHPYVTMNEEPPETTESSPSPSNPKAFAGVIEQLRRASGVDFSQYKPNTIHRRALRRMIVLKLDSLDQYAKYLRAHSEEGLKLFEDVLIPVTSFFRDFEAFEALKTKVYPAIVKGRANKGTIRMWAPGCSTGEETYSLAITLLEFLGDRASSFQVQIFGTDLNDKSIQKARAGVYRESIAEEISPERLSRFFVKVEAGYRVNKAVREMCIFSRQNLASDPPFSQMNLVTCRNLLIYIQPVLQKKIIPILHYALKPEGFLLLGSSESVAVFPDLFSAVDKKHKIYARKATASRLHYDFAQAHFPSLLGQNFIAGAPRPETPVKEEVEVQAEADRLLLKNHTPAGVIVNSALEVVQFRGRTTPYLEQSPGKPSLNVLKLARNGLGVELRTLIAAVTKKRTPVKQDGVLFEANGLKRILNLSVLPLGDKGSPGAKRSLGKLFFLILFEDVTPPVETTTRRKGKAGALQQSDKPEAKRLKRELAGTREALYSSLESEEALKEEFQSANEEILSANEELQSTNEELETSKEELQSANEELNTLNSELRHKNNELHDLNNDISNLLNSTRIPVVMLDRHLRIRRFTPSADKLLKLAASDIGRPLGDIRPNIQQPDRQPLDLESMIAKVIDSLQPAQGEVKDFEGHWHSLSILPYRTQDDKIDGAVLALQDIDTAKLASEQLRKSSSFFRGVMDTVREPLLVLDAELRVIAANSSFVDTFHVSQEETVGKFLYDLGNRQWNIPLLQTVLERVLPAKQAVTDFEVGWEFEQIGHRNMLLNARTLSQTRDDAPPLILLAIEDVTDRRNAEGDKARLAAIVESSNDAIIRKDLHGIIETWNPGAERLFGYKAAEVIGHPVTMLMPPDRVNEEPAILERIRKGEHIGHYESVRRRKDGRLVHVALTISPIFDANGNVVGASKVARDISERIRTEQELHASEERFRMLADNMSQLAWTCDELGNVIWYNQRWLDYTGMTLEDMKGWGWSKVQHPDYIDRVVEGVKRSRDTGEIWEDTFPLRGKDGVYRWFLSRAIPIRGADGKIRQWFGTNTDITESRQVEEALRESEKGYRELLDALPVAVYTTDAEGTIALYNEAATAFAGRRAMVGVDKWCVSHRLYRPDGSPLPLDECPMAMTLRTGEPQRGAEAIAERPDGTRVWYVPHPTVVRDTAGAVSGGINVLVDITDRKLAEEALIKSEKLAAAGRLAATLAHEINNPLQAVTNLLTLLVESPGVDKQAHEFARLAAQELKRVAHMTQQSLGFYRESTSPSAVNVEEMVEDLLRIYARRIAAKKITVRKQYEANGAAVVSYPGEMRQVLSTLLMNAMEAVPEGGRFALRVSKSTDWTTRPAAQGLRVTLADNGCGIPIHHAERIFEPFFTTKGENGTGLGLWIARGIVHRLGGSINLRSSVHPEKSGTCFSVFLPHRLPK